MLYTPDTKSFGIICNRGIRAYGIREYYVKWIESPRMDNYYLERELEYWVKEYDKVISDV